MELTVIQAGSALRQLVPELAFSGAKINEALQIRHPQSPWDLDHLLKFQYINKVVLSSAQGLDLEGGLFKVRQLQRGESGALMEGTDVIL